MPRIPLRPSPEEPVSHLRRIPIEECGEPLVDLSEATSTYWVPRHPVFAYKRVPVGRTSMIRMLEKAAGLLPNGVRLAIVECWRAPAIQQQMHDATRTRLLAQRAHWSPRHLTRAINRFSAPMGAKAPPPHTTGGAVDVNLVGPGDEPLDLWSPYTLAEPQGASASAPRLTPAARENRRILRTAMLGAGFTNYPAEWWHWSYGDQGWAYRGGHPAALYGAVTPEGLEEEELHFAVHETPGF